MNQKFNFSSVDEQINKLLSQPSYHPLEANRNGRYEWSNEFGSYLNDNIALQTFVKCLHAALESSEENAILMALGVNVSTERYPHLIHAVRAYSHFKYQAAIYAAEIAQKEALNDTSLNRNFAYSATVLLIAHANERLGEDTAVITTLLKYKQQLEQEFGKVARQWIKDLLGNFRTKMGQMRFQDALSNYQKYARPFYQ